MSVCLLAFLLLIYFRCAYVVNLVDVYMSSRPGVAGQPLTVDVRSPAVAVASNGILSPSSGPSSIGWDSRTPLIPNNSSPPLDNADRLVLPPLTSPSLSVNSLGGATDTTELDNYASDLPDATTPLRTSHSFCTDRDVQGSFYKLQNGIILSI